MGHEETRAGVSWYDVRAALRAVGAAHHGYCDVLVSVPVRADVRHAVDVRVRFRRGVGKPGELLDVGGVSGIWPDRQSGTFAALVFRLAYELDASLEERGRERLKLGQERLSGF